TWPRRVRDERHPPHHRRPGNQVGLRPAVRLGRPVDPRALGRDRAGWLRRRRPRRTRRPPGLRRGSVAADGIRRARHAAAPRRGELPVLRRPCTPGHRRSAPDGHRPPRLHPFRARRRGRRDRPWNLPLMLESWKVALAWGNTVVLKPAEDSPASATLMARLALEAGLPPGVLNVLHGYGPGSAGAALTGHPRGGRVSLTRGAGPRRGRFGREVGGKGANIVVDAAGLGNAIAGSIRAIFSNAGQVCLAGSRLYVQRGSYAEFTDRFVAAAHALVA